MHTSLSRARIRNLPVHDYMTHEVKIDILTGREEKSNMDIILKIDFHGMFIGIPCIFSKLVQLIMKV